MFIRKSLTLNKPAPCRNKAFWCALYNNLIKVTRQLYNYTKKLSSSTKFKNTIKSFKNSISAGFFRVLFFHLLESL